VGLTVINTSVPAVQVVLAYSTFEFRIDCQSSKKRNCSTTKTFPCDYVVD
jgi:hypothetical protein